MELDGAGRECRGRSRPGYVTQSILALNYAARITHFTYFFGVSDAFRV